VSRVGLVHSDGAYLVRDGLKVRIGKILEARRNARKRVPATTGNLREVVSGVEPRNVTICMDGDLGGDEHWVEPSTASEEVVAEFGEDGANVFVSFC